MTTTENSSTLKPGTIRRRSRVARARSLAAEKAYMDAPSPELWWRWHDAANAFHNAAMAQYCAIGTYPKGI